MNGYRKREDSPTVPGAAYIRFSSEMQSDSFSLDAQLRQIKEQAERDGVEIVKVFADPAQSAYRKKFRPGINAMRESARLGDFKILYVHKVDRLARRLEEMVGEAVGRCLMNMRQSTLIEGILHRDIPEYPEEAVREALINAIAHRDYSPYMVGSQVRIEMFADRLEIMTPGGLFGPVNESNLESTQSTRNQLLMRILSEIGLVENRGSGIEAMLTSLREAHLEPPRFQDTRTYFTVTFSNQTLLDPETVAWLNLYASLPINPHQRTALAYLHRHKQITNPDYCRLNNVDSLVATRELRGLVEAGAIAMHGTRRWAYYSLADKATAPQITTGVLPEIHPRQQAALEYLRQHGQITSADYVRLADGKITQRTAQNDLSELEKMGLLRQMGSKRATYYILISDNFRNQLLGTRSFPRYQVESDCTRRCNV